MTDKRFIQSPPVFLYFFFYFSKLFLQASPQIDVCYKSMIFMIHGHPDISPLTYFISPHTLQASVFWPAARSSCPASPCWSRAACSSPPRTSLMRGPTPAWRATPGASTRRPLTWWCGVSVHERDRQQHFHILPGHTWKTKCQNSPSRAFFFCAT